MPTINEDQVIGAVRAINDLPEEVNAYLRVESELVSVNIFAYDKESFRAVRRAGRVDKVDSTGGGMKLTAIQFGDVEDVAVTIFPPSDVCKRVQVGVESRQVVETVETGQYEEVAIYEWQCEGVLVDD